MTDKEYENIRNLTKEEREEWNKTITEKNSKVDDMWLPLFTAILNNQPNIDLEKEVAYLHGKVDLLEKLLTNG